MLKKLPTPLTTPFNVQSIQNPLKSPNGINEIQTRYAMSLCLRTRRSHVRVMPGAFPFNHLQTFPKNRVTTR